MGCCIDSNYRTISSALAYFNGRFPAALFAAQKDQHIEAFTQAKSFTTNITQNSTYDTRVNALWDEVIDILTNGDANTVPGDGTADAYSLTDPTDYNTSYLVGYGDARDQLDNNRAFIIAEITAWIADQVAAENSPFVSSFTYDSAKCEEDIGLILDALKYDLTYGGNLQTFDAAIQYFVGATSQLGATEKAPTVAAYGRLKTVIQEVILETTVTKSSGNAQNQNTSATAGSADSATFAAARIQEIIDYIDGDGVTQPTKIEPGTAWVNQTLVDDLNRLNPEAQKNIGQNVNAYIENQVDAAQWYNFSYDNAKCLRNTKLIVEAVAKDTWDTGNRYSRSAG